MFIVWGALIFGSPFTAVSAEEARLDLQPGLWEIKGHSDRPFIGVPKDTSETKCLDDGDPLAVIVKTPCKSEERVLKDGVLSFKVACKLKEGGASISGQGELRSAPPGFKGVTEYVTLVGGHKIETKTDWSGKRLGDCK